MNFMNAVKYFIRILCNDASYFKRVIFNGLILVENFMSDFMILLLYKEESETISISGRSGVLFMVC